MPVITRWYYQKRVIQQIYYGIVTREDVLHGSEEINRFIAEGTPRMYIIVDNSRTTKLEASLQDIRSTSVDVGLDIVAWTVMIGMNPIARFFASVVLQIMNSRFRFMKDTKEAVEFLRSIDESLRDLPIEEFDLDKALSTIPKGSLEKS